MTDFTPPAQPDWTRRCKGSHLMTLTGMPHMLRESEDPDSAWRHVAVTNWEGFVDEETSIGFSGMSVEFHGGGVRMINESDDVEVGFIRPPWWPDDAEPPEWPRR